eukprot:scaffold6570_cov79-Amphora_coffeaeformis.AAC.3
MKFLLIFVGWKLKYNTTFYIWRAPCALIPPPSSPPSQVPLPPALAQLGERKTEDLEAPCSIHGEVTILR